METKKINLVLRVEKIKSPVDMISISAYQLLSIDSYEDFQTLKENIRQRIENRENLVSFAAEIYSILRQNDFELDSFNRKKITEDGKIVAKNLSIMEQRSINRILDAIEEQDPTFIFDKTIEIEIRKDDFDYLYERVKKFLEHLITVPSKGLLLLFDYLIEVKESNTEK